MDEHEFGYRLAMTTGVLTTILPKSYADQVYHEVAGGYFTWDGGTREHGLEAYNTYRELSLVLATL